MYSSTSIDALTGRIAWAPPMQPSPITLETRNSNGASGRLFSAFHASVVVEHIYLTMAVPPQATAGAPDMATFNEFLFQLNKQAVLKILARVFDLNDLANYYTDLKGNRVDTSATDWSDKILSRPAVFDEAIGNQVAYDALNLMINSTRSNTKERILGDKLTMKLEADGIVDENGKRVSAGVSGRLSAAVKGIIKSLFPETPRTPFLRGVNVW